MKTMYPTVTVGSQRLEGNDSRHNKVDPNSGGGPTQRTRKMVPPAQRGGFGHHGQRVHVRASMPGGRGGTGNPASRGGTPHSFHPETRNPNKGGGVQTKHMNVQRQFGHHGQVGVPQYPHSRPQPSAGNVAGRAHKRIAGHFTQRTKGAGGNTGKYGGPPVRLDT